MPSENAKNQTYWAGGPFVPDIHAGADLPSEAISSAKGLLWEFVGECHKYYIAASQAIFGLSQQHARFEQIIHPDQQDNLISLGSQFTNAPQSPGSSTTASMTQGEFLDSLREGGAFEIQQCKSLIVLIYHLWDEEYRPKIANSLNVCPKQVQSDLMGDIRGVRILIIHKKSVVPQGFSKDLQFLELFWDIAPGELKITYTMTNSFMEQLNALQLKIADHCPDANCKNCSE